MRKLIDAAGALAEVREFMDSGRKLNPLRQPDLSLWCASPGLRCRGLFCDISMLPHFTPLELAVLRWGSFFPEGRTFRMYLAHLEKGRQVNDCDTTSWCTDRLKDGARGLSNTKN